MRRAAWALLLALAVASSGCHRNRKAAVKVETLAGESTVLPRAVAPSATFAGKATPRSVDVKGKTRGYVLVEPATPTPGPRPLVLVYHGDGGSASGLHKEWPWEGVTLNDAFVAYPDGIASTWDLETKTNNKDIDFAVALVDELAKTLPIDKTRVFGAGYSSGGFFVNVVACHRPTLFRGISSSAGGAPYNQAEKWPNGAPKCPGQEPVALLAMHGDRDFSVGLDSGRYSSEYWAYVNGCNEEQAETTGYAQCTAYRGCKPGKPVVWCPIPGLDHWVWTESAAASWTFFQRL